MRAHEYDNHKDVRSHDKIDTRPETIRCTECNDVLTKGEREQFIDKCAACIYNDNNHTENDW